MGEVSDNWNNVAAAPAPRNLTCPLSLCVLLRDLFRFLKADMATDGLTNSDRYVESR